MKKIILIIFGLTLSLNITAQDQFKEQFCEAFADLRKKVKKKKIKTISYNDTTSIMASKLNLAAKPSATDYDFMKGFPIFQLYIGSPMSGDIEFINSFQIFLSTTYVKLNDDETQKTMKKYINEISKTVDQCDCKKIDSLTIPSKIMKNKSYSLKWDCDKKGIIKLNFYSYNVQDDISEFVCYIGFSF